MEGGVAGDVWEVEKGCGGRVKGEEVCEGFWRQVLLVPIRKRLWVGVFGGVVEAGWGV